MSAFQALLLDERDIFIELVTLTDESQLTARHIDLRPYGGDCDCKTGEYRWDRQKCTLVPLPRRQRALAGRPTLEQAAAFDWLRRWKANGETALTEVTLAWLDDMVRSADFRPFRTLQMVRDYIAARGIAQKGT